MKSARLMTAHCTQGCVQHSLYTPVLTQLGQQLSALQRTYPWLGSILDRQEMS